jgi:hypothetical protein
MFVSSNFILCRFGIGYNGCGLAHGAKIATANVSNHYKVNKNSNVLFKIIFALVLSLAVVASTLFSFF